MRKERTISTEIRDAIKRKLNRTQRKESKKPARQEFNMKGWSGTLDSYEWQDRSTEENKECYKKNMQSWVASGIIPIQTECDVCGKLINFRQGNMKLAIHFDHRNEGNEPIGDRPTMWLRDHPATEENIKTWKDSGFGTLCIRCNHYLPTCGRKDFLIKAIGYTFGKDVMERLKSLCP